MPVGRGRMSVPAETLGNMLGLSVLRAVRKIETEPNGELKLSNGVIALPRGADLERRMAANQADQTKLVTSLKPTNINFKTFLPMLVQQKLSPDFPSHYSQSYLHDRSLSRKALSQLDADNRASVEDYLKNIQIMGARLNTNLALLKKHRQQNQAAGKPTLEVEVAKRIGNFKLVTFPGELTVQIGLNIKKAANDPHVFVAGYTNGYIYYTPTTERRENTGYAQEDCDCLVAPEWQRIFETKALEVLRKL